MSQKKRRKSYKIRIVSIITVAVVFAVILSLVITNLFIPVKYLFSYLIFSANLNPAGQMRVNFVDVGNSDCTLVELPDGKVLLIDGGDGTYSHNLKLFKELNSRGVDKIDYLVLSSVENGAAGGLAEILAYKTVDRIFAPYCPITYISDGYKNFCEKLEKDGRAVEICEYGAGVFNDEAGYYFCFLSPDIHTAEGGEYDGFLKNPSTENIKNASAVIWLEYDGVAFMFLGGTSRAVQKKILKNAELGAMEINGRTIDLTSCTVLKLSDHGSAEGAFAPLSDFLSPKAAIISVGENGTGCPSLAALSNAQNAVGSQIYRTDECGTVTITVNGGNYEISKEKQ